MESGNDMHHAFPTFTDSSVVVEKNNLNYEKEKFASFVQKIALNLKIIVFILKFHSENSITVNLMFRKLAALNPF